MNGPCLNTDRELWRDPTEQDVRIHVTAQGKIGITTGGHCYVFPLEQWYQMAHEKHGKKLGVYVNEQLDRQTVT